jgi:hypothetical protein
MEKITKTDLGTRLHMHSRRNEYSVLDFVVDFSTTIWIPVKKINTKICSAQLSNIDPISLIGNTFIFKKAIFICLYFNKLHFKGYFCSNNYMPCFFVRLWSRAHWLQLHYEERPGDDNQFRETVH